MKKVEEEERELEGGGQICSRTMLSLAPLGGAPRQHC